MAELHFLLLEDNSIDAELIATTLRNSDLDCDFTIVETQADFESVLKSQPLDLILADYSLPTFDGMSAIKFVTAQFPDIPCILISGVLGEDRAVESLKNGAADYVLKQRLERLVPAAKRAMREYSERRALARATAQMKESEARFRTSVETMSDPLAIIAAVRNTSGFIKDFVVEHLNRAACEYLSVSLDQQRGKSLYEAIPALKQSTDYSLFDAFCRVIDTGYSSYQETTIKGKTVNQQRDQQQVVLDIRAAKLNDNSLVITWRDITKRRKIEQQHLDLLSDAERSRNQAEEANRAKDIFLAHLSHELRSPISTIKGWLQIIENKADPAEILPKALKSINRNTEVLETLIGDLLKNAQIERGQFSFNPRPLSTQDTISLIETSIEALMPIAQAKAIAVEFSSDDTDSEALIMGDSARLEQVVRNLLSNAIKFTPKQGKVTLSLGSDRTSLKLEVKDTGRGIDADALKHVFERFWQSQTTSNSPNPSYETGLGLGLSIVYHIVESHSGEITVDSAGKDQGSTFSVRLPLIESVDTATTVTIPPVTQNNQPRKDQPGKDPQKRDQPQNEPKKNKLKTPSDSSATNDSSTEASATDISLAGSRILVVEDYPDALETYKMMLESYDAEVEGTRSASEALSVFSRFRPHILISDLGLPDESGYSLIRKIRALPASKGGDVPAVALTAFTEDPHCTRALLAGFQLHIAKPIDLEDMVSLVFELYRQQ